MKVKRVQFTNDQNGQFLQKTIHINRNARDVSEKSIHPVLGRQNRRAKQCLCRCNRNSISEH